MVGKSGMELMWAWVWHQLAGWIHAHLDQAARIEMDLAFEEHGLTVLRSRIELGLSGLWIFTNQGGWALVWNG